jgi:hypothetical protein
MPDGNSQFEMRDDEPFVEEEVEADGTSYFLTARAQMNDDTGLLGLRIYVSDKKHGGLADAHIVCSITNPIDIVAAYLTRVAHHFGFCVGAHFLLEGGRLCIEAYNASRAESPDFDRSSRCRDSFKRLKEKKGEVIDLAKTRLKSCAREAWVTSLVG